MICSIHNHEYSQCLTIVTALFLLSLRPNMYILIITYVATYINISGRNKDQKLVGRFLENQTFCRFLIAVPLKMHSKFSRPKWILVGQMLKLVGKWPMASCYF